MRSLDKLLIKGVDVWDTGTYTCEIEGDIEEQTTVSHFLQVLGQYIFFLWLFKIMWIKEIARNENKLLLDFFDNSFLIVEKSSKQQ